MKEKRVLYLENLHNINKDFIQKEYFENEKGLKLISSETGIPYHHLSYLFNFYGFKQRSVSERNKLANKTMQKRLLAKYGINNPWQMDHVRKKSYSEETNKKRKESIKKVFKEKYGVENPWQLDSVKQKSNNPEVRKKALETKKKNFEDPIKKEEFKTKQKETLRKNYGVENIWQLDSVKQKCNTPKSIAKSNKTKLEKGLIAGISEEDKWNYKQYCREVKKYTEASYKRHKKIINPFNYKRGKWLEDFQLDHKFSKIDGFRNNIHPRVIGSLSNLQMISVSENTTKNYKSSISLEELFEQYGKELYWGDENE